MNISNYDPWELYNAFLNQCTCDKKLITELYLRFRVKVLACGRHLIEHDSHWSYIIPNDKTADHHLEFLDFIDGNGFIVEQVQADLYRVTPQYPKTPVDDPKSCVYKWE